MEISPANPHFFYRQFNASFFGYQRLREIFSKIEFMANSGIVLSTLVKQNLFAFIFHKDFIQVVTLLFQRCRR